MTVAEIVRDTDRSRQTQTVFSNDADSSDPYSIKKFLTDGTIGTLTGISKLWADLDMYEAPFHPAIPVPVRARALAAMAESYIMRKDFKRLKRLEERIDPLTPEFIHELYLEHAGMKKSDRKVHMLIYGQKELNAKKEDIEERIRMNDAMLADYTSRTPTPRVQEMILDLNNIGYNLLRQKLGIAFSEYDFTGVREAIEDIKRVPDRYLHETNGHTRAAIDYWEHGGERDVHENGHFRVVPLVKDLARRKVDESYWLRRKWGTRAHPGEWRRELQLYNDEMRIAAIAGVVLTTAKLGAMAFKAYLPAQYRAIEQLSSQATHMLAGFGMQ